MAIFLEFILSLLFLGFSIFFTYFSYATGVHSSHPFHVGPGIFPFVVSLMLVLLGLFWSAGMIKVHGLKQIFSVFGAFRENIPEKEVKNATVSLLILIASTLIYVFVLMPRVGFEFSSAVFLLATTLYFGRMKVHYSLAVSLLVAFSIGFLFRSVLYLPLP